MNPMTLRERLFAALDGRPVDRVPVWLLFPYHPLGCYADVRRLPCYAPVVAAADAHCATLDRRNLGAALFAPEVSDTQERTGEDGWQVTRRTLRWHGLCLSAETRRRGDEVRSRRLLEDDADLDRLLAFPVNSDPARVAAELDTQLPVYLRERAEFPGERGAMMLDLGEPVNWLYHNANLEQFAVWSLTRPEDIVALLERFMARSRLVYDYCLARRLAEVYFLVGSELAAPPLVSRATFQRWIVPYAQDLIARIHAGGARAIQHFHGHIREILPDFLTMGADALHTIEAPPTGNCTLSQAYATVGDRLTLVGNIQYDEFRALTPAQMRDAVHALLEECRGRRFILSPTAGPYEESITPRMVENYLAFIRAGCGQPSSAGT
jgi:hypothetical protein